MAQCDACGNEYDKAMEITVAGARHTFDSFECAIHALAPRCATCGVTIVGHGMEADGTFYCCAHCASHGGAGDITDRV
ncbi:MAG TPA: hypothetical protein VGR10_05830 [Thermoleophilaceae bacterium]|nr:hypothetical protein [Thermoleophilaceae bacterium]